MFFISKFILKIQKMFVLQKIVRASKFVLKIQKSFMLHKNVHKLQKCSISDKCLGNSNFSVFIKFVHMFKKCSCFQISLQIQKIVHMFIFFTNSKNCSCFRNLITYSKKYVNNEIYKLYVKIYSKNLFTC